MQVFIMVSVLHDIHSYMQAVCCSDEKHCCPNGYKCEVSGGKCTKGDHSIDWLEKSRSEVSTDWLEKTESRPVIKASAVPCPDGKSQCPSGNTCCLVGADRYGCCPKPDVSDSSFLSK